MTRNVQISLIDKGDVSTKGSKKGLKKGYIIKDKLYTEDELIRFATDTINDRIKFCREKKDPNIDRCACEAIKRWIKLFKGSPMEGSKELGALRVSMVEKVFEEMKKEGKIKFPG